MDLALCLAAIIMILLYLNLLSLKVKKRVHSTVNLLTERSKSTSGLLAYTMKHLTGVKFFIKLKIGKI